MSDIPVCRPGVVRDLEQLVTAGHRFGAIYADPPWRYDNASARGAAEKHYRTMDIKEICGQPIAKLADTPCHLHLWTTNSFLREAFSVRATPIASEIDVDFFWFDPGLSK